MIWKHDHAEPISQEEYDYWMSHVLPLGWAILSAPVVANVDRDAP